MFLRKLLKLENKLSWILIDLVIVIIGVYTAFLIQSYAEKNYNEREKEKVLTALKVELESFRLSFPRFADYMAGYHDEIKDQEDVDFSGWRYIEPQYAYQIVEYAIRLENNEIIDFELYDELQKLFVGVKQLEHVERLITAYSGQYKVLIKELDTGHPSNLERKAENASNLYYFKLYVRSRARSLQRVAIVSEDALEIIDNDLGLERARTIELDFLEENAGRILDQAAGAVDQAVPIIDGLFPKLSTDEIRTILEKEAGAR